jgi:hypothetical protein
MDDDMRDSRFFTHSKTVRDIDINGDGDADRLVFRINGLLFARRYLAMCL